VARRFGDLATVRAASVEELAAVDQIGPVIAESIVAFMANPTNAVVLDRLSSLDLALSEPDAGAASDGGPLEGKVIVVTGAIAGMTRLEVEAAVEAAGGKATGSVSKKTFCVVLGDAPGASKVAKAESLGIPMLAARSFAELLTTGVLPAP
jgi:DNA ligase (NAD+)